MKTKYRTDGRDARPPERAPKPQDKPGTIGAGKLGVYDHRGRLRGQVGPKATAATAARFTGQHGSKLGTGPDGKPAWLGPKPNRNVIGGNGSPQAAKLAKQIKTSRGSVASRA
jgi:hypothetical protein